MSIDLWIYLAPADLRTTQNPFAFECIDDACVSQYRIAVCVGTPIAYTQYTHVNMHEFQWKSIE